MLTKETDNRPTPHGGVSSAIYYLDDAGQAADKSKATRCEIVELDRSGNVLHRTYGELRKSVENAEEGVPSGQSRDDLGRFAETNESHFLAKMKETHERLYGEKPEKMRKADRDKLAKDYRENLPKLDAVRKVARVSGEGTSSVDPNASKTSSSPVTAPSQSGAVVGANKDAETLLGTLAKKAVTSSNLVHLKDLREAHSDWTKEQFDTALSTARKQGRITLKLGEGRYGFTESDKASGVYDVDPLTGRADRLLLYAAVRNEASGEVNDG